MFLTKFIKKNQNGMTLIEVIVAIALFGIIAISLLPLFTSGIKFIVHNGNQVKNMYTHQNAVEEKIAEGADTDTTQLTIKFDGKEITVEGETFNSGSFDLFISKK